MDKESTAIITLSVPTIGFKVGDKVEIAGSGKICRLIQLFTKPRVSVVTKIEPMQLFISERRISWQEWRHMLVFIVWRL